MFAEPVDKTALGQMISHKPTDISDEVKPGATPGKTAVGNVVSHVPTGIKGPTSQGAIAPVQAKVVPHSSAITDSRSDGSVFAKIPLAFWVLSVVLLVFISATGVAIGVVLYLISARSVPLNNPQVVANRTYKNNSPSIENPNGKTILPGTVPPKENRPQPQRPSEDERLISQINTGSDNEKVKAINEIAVRGTRSEEAAQALCQAALSSSKDVSRNALVALEKVAPDLHNPVFILLVDGQAANHHKAIAKLRDLGAKAKPAVPVLIHRIRVCRDQLRDRVDRFQSGGWASGTLVDVINDQLVTLPKIDPENPLVLNTTLKTARMNVQRMVFLGRSRTKTPFRALGIGLLGMLAAKESNHRATIMPALIDMLQESIQEVKANQSSNQFNNQQKLLDDLLEVEFVGYALLKCGPTAKNALKQQVIPLVKELEFHSNSSVRERAKFLRKSIETASSNVQSNFPIISALAQNDAKFPIENKPGNTHTSGAKFPIKMVAGKTYIIDLQSQNFDAYLRLKDAFDREVARDDDSGGNLNARITYRCTQSGEHQIIASSLGGRGSGLFLLNVRQQ